MALIVNLTSVLILLICIINKFKLHIVVYYNYARTLLSCAYTHWHAYKTHPLIGTGSSSGSDNGGNNVYSSEPASERPDSGESGANGVNERAVDVGDEVNDESGAITFKGRYKYEICKLILLLTSFNLTSLSTEE